MAQLIGYLSEGEQLQGRLSDPDRLVGELSMPVFLGGGLSEEVKQALLDLFAHLAYTDADGQDYYDALYNAFYPPAELVSISAVYTQSGAVFEDTPLEDLEDDLVVTAHYSNGTTEEVTTYTLSGTLTAGTSVITVTYEDKTTTFNVMVSAPAVLSSITAVYTQSGVVYPTDSLDSLKPDLVVTAHYSDSSTATVTTYTLSGTLAVGTSTITVSYGGKTTTFNVTVTEAVVLDSITTTYTQSGTVYDTDSLDSLKADLVVTAVYTDSSTEVVPSTDYTLSGTLTAGTSTVTVSYEGKTATFTVTVTEDSNMFDPATSPDLNLYIRTSTNKIDYASSNVYHMTYVPVEPNCRYKITKALSTLFRIGLTETEPVQGTSVLFTEANHGGTEITVDVANPKAAYLCVGYAVDVTAEVNEQIRASLVIEQIASPLWLFTNGYTISKATSGASNGYTYRNTGNARACGPVPIPNDGFTFTVTDSSKYNVAIYGINSLEKHLLPNTPTAVDGYGYANGSETPSWAASGSATSPYVWLALKKMDNTAFTDAELANGAEAVFTYTTS